MAKKEYHFPVSTDMELLLNAIHKGILSGSSTASYEDGSDWRSGNVRCAVRVYERYSVIGANRLSLHVTALRGENGVFVSAITSGGSQAMWFKLNTLGEQSFLERFDEIMTEFQHGL